MTGLEETVLNALQASSELQKSALEKKCEKKKKGEAIDPVRIDDSRILYTKSLLKIKDGNEAKKQLKCKKAIVIFGRYLIYKRIKLK